MKTPTRILVGGPEVTSAFVLSALAHARKALCERATARTSAALGAAFLSDRPDRIAVAQERASAHHHGIALVHAAKIRPYRQTAGRA